MFWLRCVVLLPTYAMSIDDRLVTWNWLAKFHSPSISLRLTMDPVSTLGVAHEISVNPNEHGLPGVGLGVTFGWPWKKFAQVRVGAAGAESLKTVADAMKGMVATVL